jgi:hypothetical protein
MPGAGKRQAGAELFACVLCTTDPPRDSDALERYNNARYRHYLRDFETEADLKEHLELRIRYLLDGKEPHVLADALIGVQATLEWWHHAKRLEKSGERNQPPSAPNPREKWPWIFKGSKKTEKADA